MIIATIYIEIVVLGVKEIGISDILLWAIFADRKEIAEMCWIRCENQICKLWCHFDYELVFCFSLTIIMHLEFKINNIKYVPKRNVTFIT